jgi:hypothetical protein
MKVLKEIIGLFDWLLRLVVYEAGRTVGRYQARRALRNEAKRLTKSIKSSNVAFSDALEAVDRKIAEKYDSEKLKPGTRIGPLIITKPCMNADFIDSIARHQKFTERIIKEKQDIIYHHDSNGFNLISLGCPHGGIYPSPPKRKPEPPPEPTGFPGQFDFWTQEYQERHKVKD